MLRYEALILAIPSITSDESSAIESQISRFAKESKAPLISYERWGKYRLSYPVRKNEYGVYFLARFEVAQADKEEFLKALHVLLAVKFNTQVMRHIITLLGEDAALEYVRPESLEEAPAREAGSFFKDKAKGTVRDSDIDLDIEA